MKTSRTPLTSIATGILLLTLSSCSVAPQNNSISFGSRSLGSSGKTGSPPISTSEKTATTVSPQAQNITQSQSVKSPEAEDTAVKSDLDTTTVTIYQADNDCNLVPAKVALSAGNSLENVVGKVLSQETRNNFNLAGYRVDFNTENSVATIDLRLHPASKRQFISLSSCEQYILFGSLRETLTANSQWNVKTVEFTTQGKPIFL